MNPTAKQADFYLKLNAEALEFINKTEEKRAFMTQRDIVGNAFHAGAQWANQFLAAGEMDPVEPDAAAARVIGELGSVRRAILGAIVETHELIQKLSAEIDDVQLEVLGVRNLVESVHGLKIEIDKPDLDEAVSRIVGVDMAAPGSDRSVRVAFKDGECVGIYDETDVMGDRPGVTKSGISREVFDKYVKSVNDAYLEDQKRPPLRPGQMSGLDVVLNDQGVDALIARDLRDHGAAFIAVRADGTRKVFDPRDVIIQVKPSSEG